MNNKLFSLIIVSVIVLSIATVSANDIDDVSVDALEMDNSNSIIAVSDDIGTYNDLNNEINNAESTLILNKDYAYNNSDYVKYYDGISITKNITIDGNGHTISVDGAGCTFLIKNATVTLKNINLKGSSYGTPITVENGQLTIINSSIHDINKSILPNGEFDDSFNMNDIITISNYVENYYNMTGTLPSNVVYNGKVYGLSSISYLLALSLVNYYENNTGDVGLISVKDPVGSIYGAYDSSLYYTQKEYIRDGNVGFTWRVLKYIYNNDNQVPNSVASIRYTSYTESFARALVYYGVTGKLPELMNYYGNIKISSFNDWNGIYGQNSNISIDNSTFKNMNGTSNGGIYVSSSKLSINNSIFEGNVAVSGGAIYSTYSDVIINNSKFTKNSGTQNDGYGVAISTSYSNVEITNSNFTNHIDGNMNGVIFFNENKLSTLNNCIFDNNKALNAAGIYTRLGGKITIDNCQFMNSKSLGTGWGGIFNSQLTPMEIKNSKFINNTASGQYAWGGVGMLSGSTFDIINSTFADNVAKSSYNGAIGSDKSLGGALYGQNGAIINIINSSFMNNKAFNIGGAVYTQSSTTLNIFNSCFEGNNAITPANSTDDNYKKGSGGAITDVGGTVTINNSDFIFNIGNNGGAIFGSKLLINNSVFDSNNATVSGGAINVENVLNVENSVFINNSAYFGGAINVISKGNVYKSIFIGNNAEKSSAIDLNAMDDSNVNYNIFINNNGKIIISNLTEVNINLNYNYWGTNDNPENLIVKGKTTVLNEYVLVNVDGLSTITAGDNSSYIIGFVGENVDKLPLFDVNIGIIPSGNLNQTNIILNNKSNVSMIFNKAGKFTLVIGPEYGNLFTYDINVSKIKSNLNINVNNTKYGEDVIIDVILPNDATGYVNITVGDKTQLINIVNGKAKLVLRDLNSGSYDVVVNYYGDEKYLASNNISSFNIAKANVTMNIHVDNVIFGDDVIVVANLKKDIVGNITFIVNGESKEVTIVDGVASAVFSGLNAGNYTVRVSYGGNSNYNSAVNVSSFNVAKANVVININVDDIYFTMDELIIATLIPGVSGNFTFTINGESKEVSIVDGVASAVFSGLNAGNYTVRVSYGGNSNYNSAVNVSSFNVFKNNLVLDFNVSNVYVGESVIITAFTNPGESGNVTLIVGNKTETITLVNGKATFKLDNLPAGSYNFVIIYNGNENYNVAKSSGSVHVSKFDYNMTVDVPEIIAGEIIIIKVSLPKDATNNVTIKINDNYFTSKIVNGTAEVAIGPLNPGKYNMSVIYNGDDKYLANNKNMLITVEPSNEVNLNVSDIIMFYKDGTRLVAILTDYKGNPIANATIYFVINGITYTRSTDKNGTASMALNLKAGTYSASILFNGTDKYNKVAKNITVTIKSTIEAVDIVKMYQNGTQFFAKFFDKNGKLLINTDVIFNINGVLYIRTTNNDGVARLAINLRPGEYILTAINTANNEEQGFNITVKSLIQTNDLTKYFQNASKFESTIYNKDGSLAVNKEVTFNINGVFYKRTSNDKGVVSLAINLRPGTYTITTMVDGLEMGNKVNVLPTLETKDLSMKFRDGSKFTARTVDGQGKPLANQNVTFNVNGVFYHRVSDANGIASLNINLIPGEYVITSIWNNFQTGNRITIV